MLLVVTMKTAVKTRNVIGAFRSKLSLPLKMTTAEVVETSLTVNNSSTQDHVHPDNHSQPTYEMTLGFKPFTCFILCTLIRHAFQLGNQSHQSARYN